MTSGVRVRDECAKEFNEMKLKKHCRFIIYGLTDDLREIEIKKVGNRDATYDEFLGELEAAERLKQCRYGVYDVEFQGQEHQDRTKLVFILWSPETATVKQKMLYTSSVDYLKKALVGIGKGIQATDMSEASMAAILERLTSTTR